MTPETGLVAACRLVAVVESAAGAGGHGVVPSVGWCKLILA